MAATRSTDVGAGILRRPAVIEELAMELESLRACPADLDRIAHLSYRHPNGFAKLVLRGADWGPKVRLHVWRAGEGYADDVHDHFWDFSSLTLTGTLRTCRYTRTSDRETSIEHVAYSLLRGSMGSHRLHQRGRVGLRPDPEVCLQRGDVITMPAWGLHRLVPSPSMLTATLVIQGPPYVPANSVYRTAAPADDREPMALVTPVPFDVGSVAALLAEVVTALSPPAMATEPGFAPATAGRGRAEPSPSKSR